MYVLLLNCFDLPGLPTCHENVDVVVIREKIEGEYVGLEHEVVLGVVESLKVYSNPSIVCFYLDPIFIKYVKKNSKLRILGQISSGLLKKFREVNDTPSRR